MAQFDQHPGVREIRRVGPFDAEHSREASIAGKGLRHGVALVHGMKVQTGERQTPAQIEGQGGLVAQLRGAEVGHALVSRGGHHQIRQETIHDRRIRPARCNAAFATAGVAHRFVQSHVLFAAEGEDLRKLEDKLRVEFPSGKNRGLEAYPGSFYSMAGYDHRGDAGQQASAFSKCADDFSDAVPADSGPQTKRHGKAIRLEAVDPIAPDRGHHHDLIERHRVAEFDFHPLVLLGGVVAAGAGANGPDPAAEIVIGQPRQLPVDFVQTRLE